MASIFTYQEEPHRVHSPWSTPGSNTPQIAVHVQGKQVDHSLNEINSVKVSRLEPEKHDGPIEYKLHLLLRWRRTFTYSSTALPAWTNQQSRLESASVVSPASQDVVSRTASQPSIQTRQARLQQLTTQLLWRLQQSSPFHSSSNAKLVLPVLPEATPRLGVPDRPSKLLPGLEESQGALYEIGVADDGTLVGLADEELEESLTNLRAMAASLGCVVDIHRRVIVGDCEWLDDKDSQEGSNPVTHASKLWVAEVLVRPDNKVVDVVPADADDTTQSFSLQPDPRTRLAVSHEPSPDHTRMALVGASAAGKSSLLGTLTTSVLDNGRGKSRLSLLKHRHEIASGITSSVAQELVGYRSGHAAAPIVNYATGNVSSWPDIHNLADRLVFLSDSPGLPRYSKSTFRALISWSPTWALLCIPADEHMQDDANCAMNAAQPYLPSPANLSLDRNLSLAHLHLCLKLGRPFILVITKMDLATRTGLRQLLGTILSIIKAAGKSPLLVNTPMQQNFKKDEIDFITRINELVIDEETLMKEKLSGLDVRHPTVTVPIVMTSALTGSGIPTLHALFRELHPNIEQISNDENQFQNRKVTFRTDEVFAIPPSKVYTSTTERQTMDAGVVLCGVVDSGIISLGDHLVLGPFLVEADSGELSQVRVLRRTSSHHTKPLSQSLPRSLSESFFKSLHLGIRHPPELNSDARVKYVRVRVVSLRKLRLPVSTLRGGDTGTVGIQSLDGDAATGIPLHKARKGMVLIQDMGILNGFSSFTALFPYSEFGSSGSPPLILGGHALAYIHSIRAAVKVTAVALEDDAEQTVTGQNGGRDPPHDEVFMFDDDDDRSDSLENGNSGTHPRMKNGNVRISFKFVSTVEYLEKNDQILVVPNMTPAGPVAGPASPSAIPGFSGFVGKICEMND